MRVSYMEDGKAVTWHEDVGYHGSSNLPTFEQAVELSRKAAATDARKRCLRLFGAALGGNGGWWVGRTAQGTRARPGAGG